MRGSAGQRNARRSPCAFDGRAICILRHAAETRDEPDSADELSDAVSEALRPKFQVLDAPGTVIADGTVNSELIEIPAGQYTVNVLTSPLQTFEDVQIEPEQILELAAGQSPN